MTVPPEPGTSAVVLAAGLGTRMKSRTPKVLHSLCGRPMLAYAVDAARAATGGSRPLIVVSPATAAIRTVFATDADFAVQDEPIGSGDAVRAAVAALDPAAVEVLVVNGDVPLVDPDILRGVLEARRAAGAAIGLVTVEVRDPGRLGRIVRAADGSVAGIVEVKDATPAELAIAETNAGLYAFDAAWLRRRIGDLRPSPVTGEYYVTDLVGFAVADGRDVVARQVGDDGTLAGINDRAELAGAAAILRGRINLAWQRAGVTMLDPSTAHVDATVELAPDVVLEPNVILRGATRIGEGTRIGAGSQVVDSVVGRDCVVWASVLERSSVEDRTTIGPFSHLRPGSSIGPDVQLGNFAEVKNSRLEAGVKQHHMSYLGDAHVGAGTNIGAGTITANYDGVRKHRTEIGERVFLGVATMLRAPVTLGDGAKTGAGAVVTHDVPPGTLVVGVPARIREPHDRLAEPTPDEAAASGAAAPAGEPPRPPGDLPAAPSEPATEPPPGA
jgi:bifunctional UDP-N-acetylglucosamine pyrophosphorylase/glucosamine-1-phosphate N-acetyltransferase